MDAEAFAEHLAEAGHTVHVPDLFEGRVFVDLGDGLDYAEQVGFGTIAERAADGSDEHYAQLAAVASVTQLRFAIKLAPTPHPEGEGERDPEIDEVLEAALIALDGFLASCPQDMRMYTDEAIEAATRYLKYDPNLAQDEDDDEDDDDMPSDE